MDEVDEVDEVDKVDKVVQRLRANRLTIANRSAY